MEEIWKTIEGFEDYMVSNLGNIKSYRGRSNGLIMKPNKSGEYLSVVLCSNDGQKKISVHRLVAMAFIPNLQNMPFINHKNGKPSDNRVDNLEWCTPSQNTRHYYDVLMEGKLLRDQPVVQYTRYGKYIKDWESIIKASEATGICIDDIIHSCKRRHKHESTMGFLWRFKGDEDIRLSCKNLRKVIHINKYGEKVSEYPTIQLAAKELNLNSAAIQKVCAKDQWQLGDDSIWRYAEHYDEKEFGYYHDKTFIKMHANGIFIEKYYGVHDLVDRGGINLVAMVRHLQGMQDSVGGYKWCLEEEGDVSRSEKRRHPVVCLDKQMNYICEYPTLSAAAVAMKCQPIHVSIACRDLKKSCRGYRWMYKEDYNKYKEEQ